MNLNPKQLFRLLALSVVACFTMALVGCGDDDAQYIGNDNSSSSENKNANTVTSERAVRRLEFPALKKTGKQKLIVHRLSNTSYDLDAINFATEWDCNKKSAGRAISSTRDSRAITRVWLTSPSIRRCRLQSIGQSSDISPATTVAISVRAQTALSHTKPMSRPSICRTCSRNIMSLTDIRMERPTADCG